MIVILIRQVRKLHIWNIFNKEVITKGQTISNDSKKHNSLKKIVIETYHKTKEKIRMKKKVLIVLFTIAISMSLYACNKNTNETASNDVQNPPIETATQEEESSTETESTAQEESFTENESTAQEEFSTETEATTQEESSSEIETTTQEESSTETESTAQQSQPVVEQPKVEQSQPVVEQPKVEQSSGEESLGFDSINPSTGEQWKAGDEMTSGFIYNGDNTAEMDAIFNRN